MKAQGLRGWSEKFRTQSCCTIIAENEYYDSCECIQHAIAWEVAVIGSLHEVSSDFTLNLLQHTASTRLILLTPTDTHIA